MERLSPQVRPEEALARLAQSFPPASFQPGVQYSLRALEGDAGFRRYFRFVPETGWLGVFAPPGKENLVQFLQVRDLLASLGLKVPRVWSADVQQGLAIVEDWGDRLYQNSLNPENASRRYRGALDSLLRLASADERPAWMPLYSRDRLQEEMDLFARWFVPQLLGHDLDETERSLIRSLCRYLLEQAAEQPRVLVHRDFHCRNLMHVEGAEPGLIDFQDACWGPATYDLASLCRDYYVRWSPQRVEQVMANHADAMLDAGHIDSVGREKFAGWFEAMSAQRHIKVLGIFARLWLRDGKPRYLSDLPLVMRYLMETTARIPAACEFRDWFLTSLVPLAENQPWYSDWETAGDAIELW